MVTKCSQGIEGNGAGAAERRAAAEQAAIEERARQLVAQAPPLTEYQREKLAMLLRPMALALHRRQDRAWAGQAVSSP